MLVISLLLFLHKAESQTTTIDSTSAERTDLIHPGDIVDIDVEGNLEFDWRGRVDKYGYLENFDRSAEPVFAACLSESELAKKIETIYSRLLRKPKINVKIIDRNGRQATVIDGAVKRPLRLLIKRRLSLLEALTIAGGITQNAGGEISIFRPPGPGCGEKLSESGPKIFSLDTLLKGTEAAKISIEPGDIVIVQEAPYVYIQGEVRKPGKIYFRERLSVERAIAAAGGVTDSDISRIVILRREKDKTSRIELPLKITKQNLKETELQAGDILEIGKKMTDISKLKPDFDSESLDATESNTKKELPLRIIDRK